MPDSGENGAEKMVYKSRGMLSVGVILGFLVWLGEKIFHTCSGFYFDPFPTPFQSAVYLTFLAAMLANGFLLSRDPAVEPAGTREASRVLLVYSIAVSAAVSIALLPMIVFILVAVTIFGLGILGLAPYFLFALSIEQMQVWKRRYGGKTLRLGFAKISALTALVLAVIFLETAAIAASGAILKAPGTRGKYLALSILSCVPEKNLREVCFDKPNIALAQLGFWEYYRDLEDAYFYLYGRPAGLKTAVRRPAANTFLGMFKERLSDWREFEGVSGEPGGGVILTRSSVDVASSAESGMSEYTWTMTVSNGHASFRMIAELPPDGFVTSLELIAGNESYDGVFGHGRIGHFYYDRGHYYELEGGPCLVRVLGQDLIQLEYFPPSSWSDHRLPDTQEITVRIGIAAPVGESGRVDLLRVLEAGFCASRGLVFDVTAKADAPFVLAPEGTPLTNGQSLVLPGSRYSDPAVCLRYASVPPESSFRYVSPAPSGARPVLVVDGTRTVLRRLAALRWNAGDYSAVVTALPFGYRVWDGRGSAARFFRLGRKFGGADPVSALEYALALAASNRTEVLWVHGALPFHAAAGLRERTDPVWGNGVKIYAVSARRGFNALLAMPEMMPVVRVVPDSGDLTNDLAAGYRLASGVFPAAGGRVWAGGRPGSGAYFTGAGLADKAGALYRFYVHSKAMEEWFARASLTGGTLTNCIRARAANPYVDAAVPYRGTNL